MSTTDYGVVLGCPRSGTTYLMRLLQALPDVEALTGTLLPVAVPHVVNAPLAPDVYDALAVGFERSLDAYLHSGRYHTRAAALQKWAASSRSPRALLRALTEPRPQPRRFVYKEPFLSVAPEFVWDALPGAPIIHIHRDGRDCADSLVRSYGVLTDEALTHLRGSEMRLGRRVDERYVPWWVEGGREDEFLAATPYVRAAWLWGFIARRCHAFAARPDVAASGRLLTVSYETLMREPEATADSILEHVGGTPGGRFRTVLGEAHTRSIENFRRRPPEEVAAAERVIGDALELYGYDLTATSGPSRPVAVAA